MEITSDQIRAARALLRLEQPEVARRAAVSVATIRRLEAPGGIEQVAAGTVDQVRRVLEAAGAEFIDHGVRRRRKREPGAEARFRKLMAIAKRSAARQARLPPFSENDLYDDDGLPG
jgi:transcriptional regulator with XRE-family HTH domain